MSRSRLLDRPGWDEFVEPQPSLFRLSGFLRSQVSIRGDLIAEFVLFDASCVGGRFGRSGRVVSDFVVELVSH
jgi:hypothetical protein